MGWSRLRSFSWVRHQMFYATISAAYARESDDLRHVMLPFSLFLFFFFGHAKNLGIFEATKDSSRASSKNRKKKAAFVGCIWRSLRIGTAFVRRCDVIGLQLQSPKDADPELRHSKSVCSAFLVLCPSHQSVPDCWGPVVGGAQLERQATGILNRQLIFTSSTHLITCTSCRTCLGGQSSTPAVNTPHLQFITYSKKTKKSNTARTISAKALVDSLKQLSPIMPQPWLSAANFLI